MPRTAARPGPPVAEARDGRADRLRGRLGSGRQRFDGSAAGEVWRRLSALDFISQALILAGTMVMWLIPSLIVLDRIRGRSTVDRVSQRLGLNAEASERIAGIFSSKSGSSAITVSAVVVVTLGLLGAAGAVQRLYELVFELEDRGFRDLWRRIVWPVATVVGVGASRLLDHDLRGLEAGAVLAGAATFAFVSVYFWWTMHFLLGGRLGWGELVSPAVVTALCWIGLGVFSSFYFSESIIQNDTQYGPIGDVFVLMTWLLAVGVVLILGPVVGVAWSNARRRRRRAKVSTTAPT
jgi:membrane protein